MRRKLVIYFALNVILIKFTNCQVNKISAVLNNESLNYTIVRTMPQLLDSNKIELSKTIIVIQLKKADKRKIAKLNADDWIKLLVNDSTDWAANLYLYWVYKKDASFFQIIKTKEEWKSCCKEEDLIFWRKQLSSRQP